MACNNNNRCRNGMTKSACCCVACSYATVASPASTACTRKKTKPTATATTATTANNPPVYEDIMPSEAAAFVASGTAAAFVLMAALLAVILSSAAVWAFTSILPMAHAAADRGGAQTRAIEYIQQWQWQQQIQQQLQLQKQQQFQYPLHPQQQQNNLRQQKILRRYDDADRRKRELFFKRSREPGVLSSTFSLIGGTFSDTRNAFRNISTIVRNIIKETSMVPTTTTTTATTVTGDSMSMATGNSAENEIGGSSTTATSPANPPAAAAGQELSKLLGRNFRGLRRLFNTELRTAVKNSPGNVRDFAVELMTSVGQNLRPSKMFSRGPITDGQSTTTTIAATGQR